MRSALYPGIVSHARFTPKSHRLRYRIFWMLVDLDELETLSARLRLFGWNRLALISFFDRDHGERDGSAIKSWVERQLTQAGLKFRMGQVQALCMPRVLNHVFNPLTVWFCHDLQGVLRATIYEVNNTFGERHSYVLPVPDGAADGPIDQACRKAFYVSPLMDMELDYGFRVRAPGARASVHIAVSRDQALVLTAGFDGQRREITDASLFAAWLAHPLLSLKVLAGIHWEALKTFLKGVGFRPNPRTGQPRPEPGARLTAQP